MFLVFSMNKVQINLAYFPYPQVKKNYINRNWIYELRKFFMKNLQCLELGEKLPLTHQLIIKVPTTALEN